MKKYSSEYFEKKFKILFNKLLVKEGFIDEVKKTRKELGIPIENGFANSLDLAEFLIKKLAKKESDEVILIAHIEKYEYEKKMSFMDISEKDKDIFFENFLKEIKKDGGIILAIFYIKTIIDDHTLTFTNNFFLRKFKKNNFFPKLSPTVFAIANKYWSLDLLDEHIAIHFFEKYLFLGESGVNEYIKSRLKCPNCQHIGIHYFSPDRYNMQGQSKGAFSKGYIFNRKTVENLSEHFNSIFLIIKPYATKEQAVQYIKDNWDVMKRLMDNKNTFYKQEDVHPSKIKESNLEKNQLVYSLYKLSKVELALLYREFEKELPVPFYKESIISKILGNNHGIKMSPDAIKKSATRFAKLIKIQKKPKDIRDI